MHKLLLYWWTVAQRAATGASSFANDWQWVYGAPPFAAILWLGDRYLGEGKMMFSSNWLGALEAAAAAFVLTWVVRFIAGTFSEPVKMQRETEEKLMELQRIGRALLDKEHALQRLSDFYYEGRSIYDTQDDVERWKDKMRMWKEDVEAYIIENFSITELHEFRKAGTGFERTTKWKWDNVPNNEEWNIKASYTARLSALNDMVRQSGGAFFPEKMRLSGMLDGSGGPTPPA